MEIQKFIQSLVQVDLNGEMTEGGTPLIGLHNKSLFKFISEQT